MGRVMSADLFDNDERQRCEDAARQVYRGLSDGIENLGGIVVAAGICGLDRSDLRKALDRNGRRVAVEHAIAINARLRRFNYGLATRIGSAFVEPADLDVFPRVALTPEQENVRMRALIRSMPMGDQLLADTLGGRR
jgi:hypothetical protein